MGWLLVFACMVACTTQPPAIEASQVTVSGIAPTEISLAQGATLVITGSGFAVAVLHAATDEPDVELPWVSLYDGDIFPLEGIPDSTGTELTAIVAPAQQLVLGSYQVTVGNFDGPAAEVPGTLVVNP